MSRAILKICSLGGYLVFGCLSRHPAPNSTTRNAADDLAQEYSITSTVEILKPITLDALNNDFQETKILAESDTTITLEVRTFPLRSQKPLISANPN